MISWFISGQQSSSEQHQVLRVLLCNGTVHGNRNQKQATINSEQCQTKKDETERTRCHEQEFLTTTKFRGFCFQLTEGVLANDWRRQGESENVLTK